MKTKLPHLLIMLTCFVGVHQAAAQLPVIASFSQNGVLVCSNLAPGSVASVQWASSLSGPWQSNWAGLAGLTVGFDGAIQVSVPMFYRVVSAPPPGLALIPAGGFTMGDSLDGESDAMPTVTVTLLAFYMDTNLVSYSQWQTVYSYATGRGYVFDDAGSGKGTNYPVQMVDWYDVVKWCNARSQREGLIPVYYADPGFTQFYYTGDFVPYVNWAADGYRLPTEAEWEKAARGGLIGYRFPWVGNTISESQANYYGDTAAYSYDLGPNGEAFDGGTNGGTSPVGSFAPNGYGLYDMAGNVFEWCWDWYGTPYAGGSDPRGPSTGSTHVLRGGGWFNVADFARCACRISDSPSYENSGFGFRCVRGL
jgi:formylglycine-generating enzyme